MRLLLLSLSLVALGCKGVSAKGDHAPAAAGGETEPDSSKTDDPETNPADKPQQVAGAFLYCSGSPQVPADVDLAPNESLVACLVKDKAGNRADVKPESVKLTLKSGKTLDALPTPPPADSPWHVFFKVDKADRDDLAQIAVDLISALGEAIQLMTDNTDFDWQDDPLFLKNLGISVFFQKYGALVNSWPATGKPLATPPADAKHLVFATQKLYKGDFGGLAAADKICTDAGAKVDAAKTWLALLSTSKQAAKDRLTVDGPVYNLMGDLIAEDNAHLFDGEDKPPILYTEIGFDTADYVIQAFKVAFNVVWTGSDRNGNAETTEGTCNDWTAGDFKTTGASGFSDSKKYKWLTHSSGEPCDHMLRLYCISE